MIKTFLQNWPEEVELHVYAEDCQVSEQAPNLFVHDLHHKIPPLVAFKERYKNDPRATGKLAKGPPDRKGKQKGIGFRWDAVRFSNKVYAMCDHAQTWDTTTVIWMDADMVCHSTMTLDFLGHQIPQHVGVAYLGRARKFTETGLWSINMSQHGSSDFINKLRAAYDDAENGVLAMEEYHDCWVFDRSREWMANNFPSWRQHDWNQGSLQGEGHPLINSAWGAYLDHLKGRRKDQGRSDVKDLLSPRSESYWQAD